MKIHGDFETRSTVDLKKTGVDIYARHSTTEPLCFGFAFDDEPVMQWNPLLPKRNDPLSTLDLLYAIENGAPLYGHNVGFEWAIWNLIMVPRFGWPELKIEQCYCTMAMAYAMALPGTLENAGAAVGLNTKDAAGRRVMLQMSKPREIMTDGTIIWWEDETRVSRLLDYNIADVVGERALEKRLRQLSPAERELWLVDFKINQRGVYIDVNEVEEAMVIVKRAQAEFNEEIYDVTKGEVARTTYVAQIVAWLADRFVFADGLAKDEVIRLLKTDIPDDCRRVLEIRQAAAKTSTAKLTVMKNATSDDGRMRNILQYHGAGTGRWAGRRLQTQNFPRPSIKQKDIEDVMEHLDSYEYIDLFHGAPVQVLSSCLRGFIQAAPGNLLMAADYAAVEARGLAWGAGQHDSVMNFKKYDAGLGREPYCIFADSVYGYEVHKDTHAKERQIGKVGVLQLGYQGGIGAFNSMVPVYHIDLEELFEAVWPTVKMMERELAEDAYEFYLKRTDEPIPKNQAMACDIVKQRWRAANPMIVNLWWDLEGAAISAVQFPGETFYAGWKNRFAFKKKGSFLWCRLPSGRALCYPYPKLRNGRTPFGKVVQKLSYKSVHPKNKKWVDIDTYGGKLAENVTQALCADLLRYSLVQLDKNGFPVIKHVHDEAVAEMLAAEAKRRYDEFVQLMKQTPAWAKDFPMAVDPWIGKRYRK